MEDTTKNLRKMTGIILFPVAVILGFLLLPISLVIGIILERANEYLFIVSYSIDLLGNSVCGPLFNITLIKETKKHKFGHPLETISYVIAVNKSVNNLTNTGKVIDWLLNVIDPGHTDLKYQKRHQYKIRQHGA